MLNFLDEAHRADIFDLNMTVGSKSEWPTWLLLAGFYLAWILVVFGDVLGEIATIVILIPLVVLWMSIQHELIHGHPTKWVMVNKILGYLPFAIWYPFALYRDTHLAHHNDDLLTLPDQDPESRYVTESFWQNTSKLKRVLLWTDKTLGGRLIIGAPLALVALLITEARKIVHKGGQWGIWFFHVISVGVVLIVVDRYSAISALQYVFLVSVPALSIAMIRSFYEHRPSKRPEHRTVIIESSGPLSWLFLNLNLHLVHHDLPGLPWFYLPRVYKARREQWITRNNGFVFYGYLELVRQHLTRPVDCPVHPVER